MPPQPSFLPMNKFFLRCAIYWCLLPISWAQAGVVIGGTRFIYHAGAPALSVPVSNRSEASWLIDTHILPGGRWPGTKNEGNIMPFVVTPPLFMLSARLENSMRVVYTGAPLPADRESLFTLSIAAIPSGKPEANRVQMAFRSALKLLYRPDGLAGNPQQAYRHLIWSLTPDGATVRNPTPYYVTLFLLRANERAQDNAGVVAPFATRQTDWCRHTVRCTVRWQSINDYGRVMPAQTVDLTRIH
ncbi:pili/flagellar-assembly chaperone [Salmonella enterica]|nr:pili/flagellar-assembly chaperone [Salmonella enterica]